VSVRNVCPRSQPLPVGLELQTEVVVEHPQIAVASAHDRLRHDLLHFLGDDADIGLIAAVVTEAIDAEAVVEMAEENDIVFERDIGTASAAATAAAATAASAHATATAAAHTTAATAHGAAAATAARPHGSTAAAATTAAMRNASTAAATTAAMRSTGATAATPVRFLRRLVSLTAA